MTGAWCAERAFALAGAREATPPPSCRARAEPDFAARAERTRARRLRYEAVLRG